MKLRSLQLSDRNIFEKFFSADECHLSSYHFSNVYIWKGLFDILYAVIDQCLCIFFKDKNSCFMYLPALGNSPSRSVIKSCFGIMDGYNINQDISRIENVGQGQLRFYQELGYNYYAKPEDYLCNRQDIAFLKGNRFKSKRSLRNYFIKHYDFEFRAFVKQDIQECLSLYKKWAKQRRKKYADVVYQGMLEDSFLCHKIAMENYNELGLIGYVLKIKGSIAGYTFGFCLNAETFCVLFEICDFAYRGISEFIFSQFCRQLADYQYINIMDDSGLANLRRVKKSYYPVRQIENYIVNRAG